MLRRVEEGALELDENEPYSCETFDGVSAAAAQFGTIETCHGPMIVNVPDGRALVVSLKNCAPEKRRAVHQNKKARAAARNSSFGLSRPAFLSLDSRVIRPHVVALLPSIRPETAKELQCEFSVECCAFS
ncbi:MAG TPA: hypothetical protein VM733_05150 [Thermoanaerobaculia bacterium]|nr:hypothetical protein [Thermoanaerobaculia bacterium]